MPPWLFWQSPFHQCRCSGDIAENTTKSNIASMFLSNFFTKIFATFICSCQDVHALKWSHLIFLNSSFIILEAYKISISWLWSYLNCGSVLLMFLKAVTQTDISVTTQISTYFGKENSWLYLIKILNISWVCKMKLHKLVNLMGGSVSHCSLFFCDFYCGLY